MLKLPIYFILIVTIFAAGIYVGHKIGFAQGKALIK